jgi:hypothetical protein
MKNLEKLLPKNTFIVFTENKKRKELTKCEMSVLKDLIKYYSVLDFIPKYGLTIVSLSSNAYVDFAFMNQLYNNRFEIYISVK